MIIRSPFRVAAELIALYGAGIGERVATYQVKKLAFQATPETAGQIAFWASVLAQVATLVLADGEGAHLCATAEHATELADLERQSRPQVARKTRAPQKSAA